VSPEDQEPLNLREARESAERRELARALARANGHLSKAAELLGISRPTLYDLLNRFGLRKPD
jgi:two-component system NtrC family response regulator